MNKKWKIGIGIGLALIILLCIFICYKIGTYEYVPSKPIYEIKMYNNNQEVRPYSDILYDYDGTVKGPEIKVFRNKKEVYSTTLEENINKWQTNEYSKLMVRILINYSQTMNSETQYGVKPIEQGRYSITIEINGSSIWNGEDLSPQNVDHINTYCVIYINYDAYYEGQN